MREAARINLHIVHRAQQLVSPGMTTQDIDDAIGQMVADYKVEPAFLNYQVEPSKPAFWGHACLCVNNEVFHAPPSGRIIKMGDMVTIDMGVKYKGLCADSAETFVVGQPTDLQNRLIQTAQNALYAVLPVCKPGESTRTLTHTIHRVIEQAGFYPTAAYGGHGIGTTVHQAPYVANSRETATDCELVPGMVLCLEPSVQSTPEHPFVDKDQWTVKISTGISAHYERMVAVTSQGGLILQ